MRLSYQTVIKVYNKEVVINKSLFLELTMAN